MFLMYPVSKLEICPVACKRKQIIFKRKKKKTQSTFGVIIPSSLLTETCKIRTAQHQVFVLGIQLKRKENEEILLDPKFRSLDQP